VYCGQSWFSRYRAKGGQEFYDLSCQHLWISLMHQPLHAYTSPATQPLPKARSCERERQRMTSWVKKH
jgi:hypothetical protein